jgi:F-type H+-transporting ATPase subunit epsilon
LEILTPAKQIFQGQVSSLTAPGALGYLGILSNHAPLVTTLEPGKVVYRDAQGGSVTLRSSGNGLLEVGHNKATLLADAFADEEEEEG